MSTGDQLKFTEANGERCGYVDDAGNARERYALFVDGFGRSARSELDRLWPLKVGNKVEFNILDTTPVQPTDRYAQKHYHESFEVVRQQRVTVPAGTFDTFVVQWAEKEIGQHHDTSVAEGSLWYAPQVGYFVKSAVNIVNAIAADPYGGTQYASMTYEAAEVTAPDGSTPPDADTKPATASGPPPAPTAAPAVAKPATASGSPPAPAATPAASDAHASAADRLRALQQLLDQKLITPEEYQTRRKTILDSL
jgi:hypothetical protein